MRISQVRQVIPATGTVVEIGPAVAAGVAGPAAGGALRSAAMRASTSSTASRKGRSAATAAWSAGGEAAAGDALSPSGSRWAAAWCGTSGRKLLGRIAGRERA